MREVGPDFEAIAAAEAAKKKILEQQAALELRKNLPGLKKAFEKTEEQLKAEIGEFAAKPEAGTDQKKES